MGLMKPVHHTVFAFSDPDAFATHIADPDPAVRLRAVAVLGESSGTGSGSGAVDTLLWVLRSEPDRSVRKAAFGALAAIGSRDAARAAATLLADEERALRKGALEALQAMPDAAVIMLVPLGHHTDPDVRSLAVLLAARLHRAEACDWLITLAAREADPTVAAHLAEALGRSGLPAAVPALEALRARFAGHAYLGFAFDMALRRLGDA
jgi:HEAT repeat protein